MSRIEKIAKRTLTIASCDYFAHFHFFIGDISDNSQVINEFAIVLLILLAG